MRYTYILIACLSFIYVTSCKKENQDKVVVEGIILDDQSKKPLDGIVIYIDGIKTPSGMGIITDGKRERVGQTTTDVNGHYRVDLKLFKSVERLAFYINPAHRKEGYADRHTDTDLSSINVNAVSRFDFTLHPTALLEVKFKNVNPVSDSDRFYFSNYSGGFGGTRGTIKLENCGSITPKDSFFWIGKDVCGTSTIDAMAGLYTYVFWTVEKNAIRKQFKDSVYVKKGVVNSLNINY